MDAIPGKKYQHYKGGVYRVITLALSEDAHEKMVVYESCEDSDDFPKGSVWIRAYANFTDTVDLDGVKKPRFTLLPSS